MITSAQQAAQKNRDTIFIEDGVIVDIETFPGDQYVQRIRVPKCAAAARPGMFVHVTCDPSMPMRRPLSIMRADDDCIEVLFKTHGEGLTRLAGRDIGERISVLGPIGRPFRPDPERPNALLIGGGVGIPPMVFLAETLCADDRYRPHAILGSEIPFPFTTGESALSFPGADTSTTGTMPLFEEWGVPTRLTSLAGFDGCHRGYVTDLGRRYLDAIGEAERDATRIFACGPTPMLEAVAALAAEFEVACEVSLEEYMACAVGGCAGCTVLIMTADGPAMKRVCVDGPVFEAATVAWGQTTDLG